MLELERYVPEKYVLHVFWNAGDADTPLPGRVMRLIEHIGVTHAQLLQEATHVQQQGEALDEQLSLAKQRLGLRDQHFRDAVGRHAAPDEVLQAYTNMLQATEQLEQLRRQQEELLQQWLGMGEGVRSCIGRCLRDAQ
jgi:hypothetical protein